MSYYQPKNQQLQITTQPQNYETNDKNNCTCIEYRMQLKTCQQHIIYLKTELNELRNQIRVRNNCEHKYDLLVEEIGQLKQEMSKIRDLKLKCTEIKSDVKAAVVAAPHVASPLPPPPPPPPPLPPPLQPLQQLQSCISKSCPKRLKKSNKENARPPISLDEILNIKLRKTAVCINYLLLNFF